MHWHDFAIIYTGPEPSSGCNRDELAGRFSTDLASADSDEHWYADEHRDAVSESQHVRLCIAIAATAVPIRNARGHA